MQILLVKNWVKKVGTRPIVQNGRKHTSQNGPISTALSSNTCMHVHAHACMRVHADIFDIGLGLAKNSKRIRNFIWPVLALDTSLHFFLVLLGSKYVLFAGVTVTTIAL